MIRNYGKILKLTLSIWAVISNITESMIELVSVQNDVITLNSISQLNGTLLTKFISIDQKYFIVFIRNEVI